MKNQQRLSDFYVFEGINGAGKSTVMQAVATMLREKHGEDRVVVLANPTSGPVGVELRRFIVETKTRGLPSFFSNRPETVAFATHLAMLFMADRVAMQRELLAVGPNRIILCDRYSLSTLVYQCAMIGDVHYRSPLAEMICRMHETLIAPEKTLVFDLPVQAARFRRSAQGERVDDAMMAEIDPVAAAMYRDAADFRAPYGSLYNDMQGSFFGEVHVLDANRPAAEVAKQAFALCGDGIPF